MKILWICHFSNTHVREKLHFVENKIDAILHLLIYKQKKEKSDFASWITNGIIEFEKFNDIELHVISPHFDMKYNIEEFKLKGIHYHFFKPDNNSFLKRGIKKILKSTFGEYEGNRRIVKELINTINPDVIHMYGAENPYYSITALDINIVKFPFLVTLQTLLSDPEFKAKYTNPIFQYNYNASIEQKTLAKVKYIGSSVIKYREIVWKNINPKAIFFESGLAVAEKVPPDKEVKEYDFVYFAASIEKAADLAIEGFAIACRTYSSLKLNLIGGSTPSFKHQLENRIKELGIEQNVFFSGRFPTHEEVLQQIQKSNYALLPLKIDHISGTIREAMFSGIPVISTKTHGTPMLNEKRESILISEIGDDNALAQNIIRLIESPELAMQLKENGLTTVNELWNNNIMMKDQVISYQAIYNHHHFNQQIPNKIGKSNPATNEVG